MPKIHIAVASTRRPKLNAVREALSVFGSLLDTNAQFEVVGVEVPSGVRHTPLTRAETMAGARSRVESLEKIARERNQPWRYLVGLEGGLETIDTGDGRRVFLQNWVYVSDRSGRSAWGQSPGVLMPGALVGQVADCGVELAEAIDEFAERSGIRDEEGAWGVFSRNLLTRRDAFLAALIGAFAPFYNEEIYRRS